MTVTREKKKPTKIRLMRYHTWQKSGGGHNSSVRVVLVKAGRKWLQVVAMDATSNEGLRVWRVPKTDEVYMTPLLHNGNPYPMSRALRVFRKLAKTHGITKGAKKLLKEAANENKTTKKDASATGDHA